MGALYTSTASYLCFLTALILEEFRTHMAEHWTRIIHGNVTLSALTPKNIN